MKTRQKTLSTEGPGFPDERSGRLPLGSSAALSDDELVRAFERITLPDDAFKHPDHVRLAWIYLRRMPLLEAITAYRDGLQRFARAHGAPGKYHETITWAFLILINQRLQEDPGTEDWSGFVRRNPDLVRFRDGALFQYYGPEVLECDVARRVFVLPGGEATSGPRAPATEADA